MKSIIALTVAAFALASCGGGGSTTTTRDTGILPSGFAATIDGDELVLTVDGVELARLAVSSPFAGFATYGDFNVQALYAETVSGDGAVFLVSSPVAVLGLGGVQVTRSGDTDLPSGGSATFNGQYAGLFVRTTDLVAIDSIQGDAQLIADFASASISGDITNREANSGSAEDLLLLPTAITSAGAFSGTTTGGDIVGSTTALNGQYIGLFVGATGNEVVGGVSLSHLLAGGGILIETGGFVAAE